MNALQRLFKRKIEGEELEDLILNLGKDKKYLRRFYEHCRDKFSSYPTGKVNVKLNKAKQRLSIDLHIRQEYHHVGGIQQNDEDKTEYGNSEEIKKQYTLEELKQQNPQLLNYLIKHKYLKKDFDKNEKDSGLEKSLTTASIISLLASLFFVSNNITGNAIFSANSTTPNFLGIGFFILGLAGFLIARIV
jgi:hypothetical protein